MFGVFTLVFSFGDWRQFGVVVFMGLFVGLVRAPELVPDAFFHGWAVQLFGGAAAGGLGALALSNSIEAIVAGGLIGGLLGWLAPYWVKHVTIP